MRRQNFKDLRSSSPTFRWAKGSRRIVKVGSESMRGMSSSRRKQLRLPFGPPRRLIIGNLPQLSSLSHKYMVTLCRQYGSLIYLHLGKVDAITMDDPKIIKESTEQKSREAVDMIVVKAHESKDTPLDKIGQSLKKEVERMWKVERRIPLEKICFEKWSQILGK